MEIKTTRKELMYDWLNFLDPIFKLKEVERKVLAGYLTLHYYHRHRYSDPSILDEQLFSEVTNKSLQEKYKLPEEKFTQIFEKLKNKGFLQTYQVQQGEGVTKELFKLNPAITRYPKNEKFEINITFKVQE